jgi:putative ABC transport system permease protein
VLIKLLKASFINQKKSTALMIVSVAVGTAVAASLITLSLDIRSNVSRELRTFGANILIEPKVEGLAQLVDQKRYLRQDDLIKAKTIFWRNNILGIAPFLETRAELNSRGKVEELDLVGAWYEHELPLPGEAKTFTAGIKTVFPWWSIDGNWPAADAVLVGASLASRLGIKKGDRMEIDGRAFEVLGTVETGGAEDQKVFMDLESLQSFKGLEGRISKVFASALTTPMDEFAYNNPKTMTRPEYEKWYCTAYATSIASQLEEGFPGSRARPIWRVAEAEGNVLERLTLLIYFLCIAALLASAFGVSTTMIMSLLRRTEEIGLMKALGADSLRIAAVFLSEAVLIGAAGGLVGYGLSLFVSQYIGSRVFNTALEQRFMLLPISIGSSLLISIAGTVLPIRRAMRIKPAVVLKGA